MHLKTCFREHCQVVTTSMSYSLQQGASALLPVSLLPPFFYPVWNSTIVALNPPHQVNTPWGTWCTVCLEAATTTTAAVGEEATAAACWERPCQMTPSQLSAALCMRSSQRTWRTLRPWGTLAALRSSSASPGAKETSKPNGKIIVEWKKKTVKWNERWEDGPGLNQSSTAQMWSYISKCLIWFVSIFQVSFEASLTQLT